MADESPQRRVLPARERRESAAKRRMSESSPPPIKSPGLKKIVTPSIEPPRQKRKYTKRASLIQPATPSNASTPPVADNLLPTRFISSKPLPTSRQKQASLLSEKEYQSVADSAILAASLHKSRMQWLYDGIFTKYWTKPVKKKGVTDVPPNNPDQKSMQKLGHATITIEPHSFDVTFFTVRDPSAPVPYYRHPNQHTPKPPLPPTNYGVYYPPPSTQSPSTMSTAHGPPPRHHPSSHSSSPAPPVSTPQTDAATSSSTANSLPQPFVSQAAPPRPSPSQAPTSNIKSEALPSNPNAIPSAPTPSTPSVKTEGKTSTPAPPPSNPSSSGPRTTNDPVIQMLAARAASDSRLKDLMKVVATSKASPEQLKEFQSHIDEFNAVVRRQEAERAGRERELQRSNAGTPSAGAQTPAPTPTPSNAIGPTKTQSARPSPLPGAAHPATYGAAAHRPPPPAGPPTLGPPPQYMGYTPPPPRPEPIIKHIVMELTTNVSSSQPASADRWLFPEYAVLDIRYGGLEMICSFFVVRKGSDIIANMSGGSADEIAGQQNKWKADEEYYQPVTMTVKANQHRTIETIARAAKSLVQVQDHMKDIIATKTRAPDDYLVHQLPREKGMASTELASMDFVDSAVEVDSGEEDDELLEWYGNA